MLWYKVSVRSGTLFEALYLLMLQCCTMLTDGKGAIISDSAILSGQNR